MRRKHSSCFKARTPFVRPPTFYVNFWMGGSEDFAHSGANVSAWVVAQICCQAIPDATISTLITSSPDHHDLAPKIRQACFQDEKLTGFPFREGDNDEKPTVYACGFGAARDWVRHESPGAR